MVRESSRPKSIRRRLFVGTDRRTMRPSLHGGLEGAFWPAAAGERPARRRMRPGKPESRPKAFRQPVALARPCLNHSRTTRSRGGASPMLAKHSRAGFPQQRHPGRAGGFELSAARRENRSGGSIFEREGHESQARMARFVLRLRANARGGTVFVAKMDSRLRGNDAGIRSRFVPQPPSSPGLTRGSSRPHRPHKWRGVLDGRVKPGHDEAVG